MQTVNVVQNIEELRSLKEGSVVYVLGYYEAGDGGGGMFRYEEKDFEDDGGLHIGNWHRIVVNGVHDFRMWGAKPMVWGRRPDGQGDYGERDQFDNYDIIQRVFDSGGHGSGINIMMDQAYYHSREFVIKNRTHKVYSHIGAGYFSNSVAAFYCPARVNSLLYTRDHTAGGLSMMAEFWGIRFASYGEFEYDNSVPYTEDLTGWLNNNGGTYRVMVQARARFMGCDFQNGGIGLRIHAATQEQTDCNLSQFRYCRFQNNVVPIYTTGPDANFCMFETPDITNNKVGPVENSTLGNGYIMPHFNDNGLMAFSVPNPNNMTALIYPYAEQEAGAFEFQRKNVLAFGMIGLNINGGQIIAEQDRGRTNGLHLQNSGSKATMSIWDSKLLIGNETEQRGLFPGERSFTFTANQGNAGILNIGDPGEPVIMPQTSAQMVQRVNSNGAVSVPEMWIGGKRLCVSYGTLEHFLNSRPAGEEWQTGDRIMNGAVSGKIEVTDWVCVEPGVIGKLQEEVRISRTNGYVIELTQPTKSLKPNQTIYFTANNGTVQKAVIMSIQNGGRDLHMPPDVSFPYTEKAKISYAAPVFKAVKAQEDNGTAMLEVREFKTITEARKAKVPAGEWVAIGSTKALRKMYY